MSHKSAQSFLETMIVILKSAGLAVALVVTMNKLQTTVDFATVPFTALFAFVIRCALDRRIPKG